MRRVREVDLTMEMRILPLELAVRNHYISHGPILHRAWV